MTETLFFKKLLFLDGLNITVRMGTKWDKFNNIENGILQSLDGNNIRSKILASFSLPFKSIPNNLLKLEHDPECRDMLGLYHTMCEIYPNFSADDIVTIVFFVPDVNENAKDLNR